MDPVDVRKACREYAAKFIDLQRSQFKRLGVLGRWEKPYATMDFLTRHRSSRHSMDFTKGLRLQGIEAGVLVLPRPYSTG